MQSRRDRTRPGSGQKKKFWQSRKFRWGLGIFLVLLLAVGVVYAYYINNFLNQIQVPKNPDQREVKEVEKWSGTDPVNIVLFGVDNRDNDKNPRSDSILIASIDPVTKKAKVMSVMRDTWVQIPEGYGKEKINAAFALGGPDLAIKTLKEFLQIPIHYYVKTDFQGFIGIVDALGGVEIDVEKPLHYNDDGVYDINLKQGLQRLDGQHALMYVRFRYDAMADFARTERQRKFLEAVANEISSPATLLKVPKLLEAIGPYIETNISKSDMVKLGMLAREVDSSALESMQVPPMETLREGMAGGGQSVLIPNIYETQVKVYEFLGLDPSKLDKTPNNQPSEYYQPEPVVPDNPKIEPDTPTPTAPEPTEPTPGTGGGTTTPGTGGGTTTPGTGGGTTTPGTGGGTTTPGTGGGTTTPGTGGGTTTPGTGGGTTTPGTGGGTTTPGTGGGTTTPGTGGGTTTPGTGGGTTTPGTGGGTTTPGTGGGTTTPGTGDGTTGASGTGAGAGTGTTEG